MRTPPRSILAALRRRARQLFLAVVVVVQLAARTDAQPSEQPAVSPAPGPSSIFATRATADATFAKLRTRINGVPERTGDPTWNSQRVALRVADEKLQARYTAAPEVTDRYLVTLNADIAAIDAASRDPASRSRLGDALQDVSAKASFLDFLLSAGRPIDAFLNVTVKTVDKTGAERKGYRVRANALGDPNADPPQVIFTTLTPTDSVQFSPGYYAFWVEHNGKRGGLQKQQVGLSIPKQLIVLDADIP
jgi:hypothetical protein